MYNNNDPSPTPTQPSVVLWNPNQPEFGPVFHIRANFKDLDHPMKCRGTVCPVCHATNLYTKWLRENGYELPQANVGS